jgi:hypothetical protein
MQLGDQQIASAATFPDGFSKNHFPLDGYATISLIHPVLWTFQRETPEKPVLVTLKLEHPPVITIGYTIHPSIEGITMVSFQAMVYFLLLFLLPSSDFPFLA